MNQTNKINKDDTLLIPRWGNLGLYSSGKTGENGDEGNKISPRIMETDMKGFAG